MSDRAARLPIRLAHLWVALYTRGLPTDRRDARHAEITSDLWEHCHDDARDGSGGVPVSVLGRVMAGVPADIAWWVVERGLAREGSAMDTSWYGRRMLRHHHIIIPAISVLVALVTLADLSGTAGALLGVLMVLALVGLTRGLVGSPVGTASGRGTHMETGIIHRRRTTLLIVLAVSMIILAGTYAYAMSLEHWRDAQERVFVGVGMVMPAVGLLALVVLVADVVRARRS